MLFVSVFFVRFLERFWKPFCLPKSLKNPLKIRSLFSLIFGCLFGWYFFDFYEKLVPKWVPKRPLPLLRGDDFGLLERSPNASAAPARFCIDFGVAPEGLRRVLATAPARFSHVQPDPEKLDFGLHFGAILASFW